MNRVMGTGLGGKQAARWASGLAVLALLAAAGVARADDSGQQARAVRLSYVQGQVQVTQGSEAIASQAVANMPLFQGYRITTGQDGEAEVQFEDGSVARIAPDSGLTLKVLRGEGSNGEAEIVLNGGLGYFELQGGDQAGRIDVRFGPSVVTAAGFTVMRVDVDTPPGSLAVFSGNAHLVQGDDVTLDLHGNQTVTLNAADPSQYNLAETVESNSWDQWNSDRDQALQAQSATQTKATDNFVNSQNPAWNALNSNGNWYDVPGQGFVWSPYMAAYSGWDPYGCGQWMWTPGYGYTWISCYSWGFTPYSCGMWNYYSSFGWGWSPGMGGCNTWWNNGGYGGANVGVAPSGYRPIIRPPAVLHPPKGRFPRPIVVDNRMPRHFKGAPMRQINAPVIIAGHRVQPLKPIVARTGGATPRTFVGGVERGGVVVGGEARRPVPIVDRRQGYGPVTGAPVKQGFGPRAYQPPTRVYQPARGYQPPESHGYRPPETHGYQPPLGRTSEPARGYSPPARSYSPPMRSYSPPARSYSPPPAANPGYSGGGFHGGAPSGGGFHGAAPSAGGGFHGGAPAGGGGGGVSHAGGGGGHR